MKRLPRPEPEPRPESQAAPDPDFENLEPQNISLPYPDRASPDDGDRSEQENPQEEAVCVYCGVGDPWGDLDCQCDKCGEWVHQKCDPILLGMGSREITRRSFVYWCQSCKMIDVVKEETPDVVKEETPLSLL